MSVHYNKKRSIITVIIIESVIENIITDSDNVIADTEYPLAPSGPLDC
jgi:hypothetical protein